MKQYFFFIFLAINAFFPLTIFSSNARNQTVQIVAPYDESMTNFIVGPLALKNQSWVFFRSALYGFFMGLDYAKHPLCTLMVGSLAYDVKKHNSVFLLANFAGVLGGAKCGTLFKTTLTSFMGASSPK